MKKILYIPIILSLLFVAGCNTEEDLVADLVKDYPVDEVVTGDAGSADFSNYVAVGNSLTAGFMDNSLYDAGQRSSFPAIMAEQLSYAGGGDFIQPDINSNVGVQLSVLSATGSLTNAGRLVLDASIPAPVPIGDGEMISDYTGATNALNNFGIPGARVIDLLTPLYTVNPYYARIASNAGTSTVLSDAASAGATFFSLWIGANDLLGWAVNGGGGMDAAVDGPASLAEPTTLTDEPTFSASYAGVLATLKAGGAKGVIANLPDATFTPFFRAVAWNAIAFDASTADSTSINSLNTAYAAYNGALAAAVSFGIITQDEADARNISFADGGNGIIMVDEDLTDVNTLSGGAIPIQKWRQTTAEDLIPLSTATALQTAGAGTAVPATDSQVLSKNEITLYRTRLAQFNATIEGAANADDNLGLFDSYALFLSIAINGGIDVNGVTLSPDFSPNGVYSVDGIHPNPRGYAIIANEFIKVIESTFGAEIPKANVLNFQSVSLK